MLSWGKMVSVHSTMGLGCFLLEYGFVSPWTLVCGFAFAGVAQVRSSAGYQKPKEQLSFVVLLSGVTII